MNNISCEKCIHYDNCESKEPDTCTTYQTKPAVTLSELDKVAVNFIDGSLDVKQLNSLDFLNRWLVLSLASVYSCAKLGILSGRSCAEAKYKLLSEYRRFKTEIHFASSEHKEWIKRTKESSDQLSKLANAINNKDINALSIALNIIDNLTKHDIYNKLLILSVKDDKDYMSKCLQALCKNEDHFINEFGNIPFVNILTSFFNSVNEDKAAEIHAELDADNLKKVACHVPKKSDEATGIAKSYIEFFNIHN